MEVDADYDRKKGLSKLTGEQQTLLFTALGGVGLILGYLLPIIGGIGVLILWSALMMSVPAWRNRDDTNWSKEVLAQSYALSAFGGLAAIGAGIRMWIEILG
jgi:4-hydroxybenzoate polyprenyltransferase